MSDDLRTQVAKALCENAGLSWETAWQSFRTDYLQEADAVLAVVEPELKRLSDERDYHQAAAERAEAKLRKLEHGCETPESHAYGCPCDGEPIKFRGGSIVLTEDPVTAELRFDAGPWTGTTAFLEETEPEETNYNERQFARPCRTAGVRIDGQVWMEFLRAASTVDPGSKALRKRLTELETSAEYWGANAPGGSLIDDLKNTIVSQARETARLKGESA